MGIELNTSESELRNKIDRLMNDIKLSLAKYHIDNEVKKQIDEMGDYAHELHMSLQNRDCKPKHHAYMKKNREMEEDDPQFYKHVHPVEDLLKYIDDPHANDEPQDQTIGEEFDFRVYSNSWGHEDNYRFKRTDDGWDVKFFSIGGSCDKKGYPFLYENFNHDSIQYPRDFDGWLEWLWDQAASKGLSKDEVQTALQELADWVSSTEKNVPSSIVWDGYCETPIKENKSFKTVVITFLDILGWKGVYCRKTDAVATLKKLIEETHSQAAIYRGSVEFNSEAVEVRSISDTIVLFTPCLKKDALKAIDIHGMLCKWIIPRSIELEIPIRGVISFGEFDTVDNIFVGKAVDEAATWHELADWIGVHLTPSAEYIFQNKTSECWVTYSPPIKALQGFDFQCVNWTIDWEAREKEIECIKAKFCRLGPIIPEIAGKFANTLKFVEDIKPKSLPDEPKC
ncbi:MAG: hypothetical protein AB7D09_06095 [Methanosarcina sp.]|uniref:Uncharacterized protein n=1 Tax=Methanosarcina mazei (strain ATCC BAA-159 / DSM 3647 / Goe1 / Go1 / JCM 11833 / OCM 88) TaxID=192952 RepID=Q8PSU9_METMA|nr:hypothetical protein [Methanosarcina mazei]AAM32673.1 hypothetical protein MM_2977 [Methanosarcina mazei Go1]MDY0245885.1 hypothetical protein [Methanosarcina mazei]WIM42894.1 hypothetical protein PSF70_15670 [Methanosarcina mazei]WIM46355.1 hypothetical protein PQQ20_15540 [Methanosarcina mazei]